MHEPHPPTWDDWQEKLKEIREHAGMTQRAVAHACHMSKSMVNALETGRSIPKRSHAVALDEGLATLGELAYLWDDVYGRGRRIPEWWAKPLELEKRASRILEYDPCIIPGLLQTKDYAREVLRFGNTDDIERDVTMRRERFTSLQAHVSFILTERALLSHPPGKPQLVAGQLEHIQGLIEGET
jgi:transcriptional regulator with XRE-family HTH domain